MIFLIFLLSDICLVSCINDREYHFIDKNLNWTDARLYCRDKYIDLATVTSLEDTQKLPRPGGFTGLVWMGLTDDPASWYSVMSSDVNSWRWSATESTSAGQYQNWNPTQPVSAAGTQQCVAMNWGTWLIHDCTYKRYFVCFSGSTVKSFYFVKSALSWAGAVTYCRSHYRDLAMIESAAENSQVAALIAPAAVSYGWIGLYRHPWRWSDDTVSPFTNWLSGQPDNGNLNEHCAADSAGSWDDVSCDMTAPFYCYEALKTKQTWTLKMSFSSDADLTDSSTSGQILQQIAERFKGGNLTDIRWRTTPKRSREQSKDRNCS